MATKTKRKGAGIIASTINAVEELGEAAGSFRESWQHVQKARTKAKPVARAAGRAAKATTRAAKRMLPGKRGRGKR